MICLRRLRGASRTPVRLLQGPASHARILSSSSDTSAPLRRCFLATYLPLAESAPLAQAQDILINALRYERVAINWVPPQNFHFTWHFFGLLSDKQILRVQDAMSTFAVRYRGVLDRPVQLDMTNIEFLPTPKNPRTVIAATRNTLQKKYLRKIMKIIRTDFDHATIDMPGLARPVVRKDPVPHITLGHVTSLYVPSFKSIRGVDDLVSQLYPIDVSMTMSTMCLVESELRAGQPPVYTVLHESPLHRSDSISS